MTNSDLSFVGSIPELYDRNVGPLMMVPYAGDIAGRLSDMATGRLLEVAAGTGIVTAALALALPHAQLIATDLNQPMLDHAAIKPELLTLVVLEQEQLRVIDLPVGGEDAIALTLQQDAQRCGLLAAPRGQRRFGDRLCRISPTAKLRR